MSFISLTHLQTALNKIKTIFDTKAELTDIPDKLPANGGNADTVDGKHAVDFLPNKAECVNGANYDDFAVSGFYEVLGDADNPTQNSPTGDETDNNFYLIVQRRSNQYCSQIAVSVRADNSVYIRNKSNNVWGSWTKIVAGNADTVNGKSVFYNIYSDPTQFGLTLDSSANEIWTKLPSQSMFVIDKDILTNADWNFPEKTTLYTLVVIKFTSVRPAGIYLYPKIAGKIFYALVDDGGNFVSTWRNIADGGNATTVNGYTVNANIPAGFSPIGQNTENKEYTYEKTTYTGSNTSEVFNDYTNNMAAKTYSHAEGKQTKALGDYSHAEGYSTKALGDCSHAEGYSTKASAPWSHAEGYVTKASTPWSHAEGYSTTTSGDTSHAEGFGTTASGTCSHAEGEATTASSYASHACGKFNKAMSDSTSKASNAGDVFVIGNGIADNNLSNAFRITYAGATYGLSAFNSSGADYAEFIKPWHDNNIDNEDRVGYFVTIKNGLLYKANEGDYIVGITSGNPSVVGNADEDYYWRYERDEFNRFVYEDAEEEVEQLDENGAPVLDENGMPVMVKTGNIIKNAHYKLAADYDSTKQNDYIERKNRPEWSYVGMIGVLPVRDDGTCVAGGFAKCGVDGIATKADARGFDTFFVIERISENIISVEMR